MPPSSPVTSATAQAHNHWAANAPLLADPHDRTCVSRLEFVFARDGALTARDANQWLRGCSVPRAAAEAQLRNLTVTGSCGCLLDPPHAAVIRVALDRMNPEQALMVIIPTASLATTILHLEDFSADLASGRLWIVSGDNWPTQLEDVFNLNTGLAVPQQFVRLPGSAATDVEQLIQTAQPIFGRVHQARQQRLEAIVKSPAETASIQPFCVIGGRRFRLWADAAHTLATVLTTAGQEVTSFDRDDPCQSTPLALAETAERCRAVIAADAYRADAATAVHRDRPWLTWVTRPTITRFDSAAPRDALLLADPAFKPAAQAAGWPDHRVAIAGWPRAVTNAIANGPLVVLADVTSLAAPADLENLSSHRLLWEQIAARIARDPLTVYGKCESFIRSAMQSLAVDPAGISLTRLIDQLIHPAFAVELVRALRRSSIPLDIYGLGWDLHRFASDCWKGPIKSREMFQQVVQSAGALLRVLPHDAPHPIDSAGATVIRYQSGGLPGLISDIQKRRRTRESGLPLLSWAAIEKLLA